MESTESFAAAVKKSKQLEQEIKSNPKKFLMLTGDRPTGKLHLGHYFGSLKTRVSLMELGVPVFIVIADYQVLTDHELASEIAQNTKELALDYIAAGIEPAENVAIFPHSYVPELNQLMLPFLTLVSSAELNRNPTVKEEIEAARIKSVNAGMLTYPVHQACDILFCKSNVVPVGKDQLPHLELTRTIARRFNEKFAPQSPIFPEPEALLSSTPHVAGLDGSQKMSKSRGNAIMLSATEDETAALIKKAKTDSIRMITYEPETRPEVASLLELASLCSNGSPEKIAEEIGDGGAAALKKRLTEAVNESLKPFRERRKALEADLGYIRSVLFSGVEKARNTAEATLFEVRRAMNMEI